MNGRSAAAIIVALVLAVVAVFWWTGRDSGDDTSADTTGTEVTRNDYYGDSTTAPTYEVEPGTGDDGGNSVETLPELSVPMSQPPSYYLTTMCDNARLYGSLSQQENKDTLSNWFSEATPMIERYADGDTDLLAVLDASKDSDGDPEAILEACPA